MQFELLIKGGRVIDPGSGTDGVLDVGFAGGRVTAIDAGIPADRAKQVVDATGAIVTPGLIDLHTHVYWGGTSLGVDADAMAARSGTTTFVDAGSAGAGNLLGFRRHVMERSRARILAYLNISFAGIFGFSSNVHVGECADIRLCDAREAVACGVEHADVVVGMKVRSGRIAGGTSGVAPVDLAVEAADKLQLPLMTHIDFPPPGRSEVIARLRPGDILTHCFRPFPNAPIDGAGLVREDAKAAKARGVVFDIGHGMGSFDFEVAETMLKAGYAPDVVSSDVHLFCADGPAYDVLVCLSKLMTLGMPLVEAIRSVTAKPAAVIGRPDLGTLAVGSVGDAAVLRLVSGQFPYVDASGRTRIGSERLVSDGVAMGGVWWANEGPNATRDLAYVPNPPTTHTAVSVRHFGHCGHHHHG
ncbi:MAG: amidohydrolase/deacetylase family metallohydrolase [Rhizobiales bacterium]|nr:amidohydrolase/deacetylase family metallohydrolase [Hyphomicrobiales bacterium]